MKQKIFFDNIYSSNTMYRPEVFAFFFFLIVVSLFRDWRMYYFSPISKKKNIEKTERLGFFDFIKGLAILAVMIIHIRFWYDFFVEDYSDNYFFLYMNNLSRFAIPVFFISSGILLEPWKLVKDKPVFYLRKAERIFLPYLFVVLIAALYFKVSVAKFVYWFFSGTALAPFYFMSVLLQLYLIYPFLDKYRHSKKFFIWVFVISSISNVLFSGIYLFGTALFINFLFFFFYGIY